MGRLAHDWLTADVLAYSTVQLAILAVFAVAMWRRVIGKRGRAVSASIRRGDRAWRNLHTAHAMVSLAVVQILSTAQVSFLKGGRGVVALVNLALLWYLMLMDPWCRNRVVGFMSRFESRPEQHDLA